VVKLFAARARPKGKFQLVFEVADPAGIAFRFVVAVHHDLHLNAFLAGFEKILSPVSAKTNSVGEGRVGDWHLNFFRKRLFLY
jgi:hypothetical protein